MSPVELRSPAAMVVADTVYGTGEVERALRREDRGCVLGTSATQPLKSWIDKPRVAGTAEAIAQGLDASAWRHLSAGESTKGARLYDWAYLELADLEANEFSEALSGTWTRGLLVRRSLADGKCAYFITWCPAGTSIEILVRVEGQRWAIEDAFEVAKTELGLDYNETRSWHGWHRHVSLTMLAFAMLASIRHHANQPTALSQTPQRATHARKPPSSAGRSRKSGASPRASRSGVSIPPESSPGRSGAARTRPKHDART